MTALLSFASLGRDGLTAPLTAGLDTSLIFLAIVIASAIAEFLKKRKHKETQTSAPPIPAPPSGNESEPDWIKEIKRALEGEQPVIPPPPPPPIVVRETTPRSPPLPVLTRAETASDSEEIGRPLATLQAAQQAYQRGSTIDQQAATRLAHADQHTDRPAPTPPPARRRRSPEILRARALLRSPASAREAMIASVIFAPPKALE